MGWSSLRSVAGRARSVELDDRARYLLQIVGVAAAYAVSGKLGLKYAFESSTVTAIWPPTGIALAALVLGGYRLWPGVALGALFANLDTGVPAVTVLGITIGNTLEALTGAFLLRRAGFRPSLERLRDVLLLIALGAVISTTVSATIGVTSLLIGGVISWARVASLWRTWWLGDMGGDLVIAPALLIAATHRHYRWLPGRSVEAAVLALLLTGVSVLVFSQSTQIVYALFPLLIWAALRFWQAGAAGAGLLVGAIAVSFTANMEGPFASSGPNDRLLLAQTFVAVASVTALVLAAVTSERRRAEEAEREIAETLQRSLLPDAPPPIAGWQIATLYRPAGAAEVEVGGDFYDFFETSAGWMVIIGDVVGKGVEAAAMAGLVRHGARFVSQTESGPAAILARLDHVLREQPTVSLCSALCVCVHPGHLVVSSAGHPGPIVVSGDGRIREIGGGGPMLGFVSGANWPERTVQVAPGEIVLLYTDGVTDTRGETDRFGQRRLAELLIREADRSPHELLAELESALDRFRLGRQSDDTAAIALGVEHAPDTPRTRWRFATPRAGPRIATNPPDFHIEALPTANAVVIRVVGEIDHTTADRVADAFRGANGSPGSRIVLDLARVTFVDSAGLRTFVGIERLARELGTDLQIIAPPEDVRAVFRLSGVERLLRYAERPRTDPHEFAAPERTALELPVGDTAPGQARAEVRKATDGRLSEPERELAVLITSELVTNAVKHPEHRDGGSIGLAIDSDEERIRVEVSDSGQGFKPGELKQDASAEGGRGLVIVDRGATNWGTRTSDRFCVWFELVRERARRSDP
jgi:anti-anti-sigma factor